MKKPPVELAWAAGLFEGEGSVRINSATKRNLGHLLCSVVNTDISVVEYFQKRWPGYLRPASGLRPDQRPAWVWLVAANKATEFIEEVYPYVITTRVKDKMKLGLAFQKQKSNSPLVNRSLPYKETQKELYLLMKDLNRRGNKAA